ncbi:MAG: phosphocholine cytidylyltransferase family protein [Planctomycetaceae bacterium]|nr:phosphocholine cytidylyltransferase family protein [Planctomycetales bacterium]MCB9875326.1 phosphocholine cytidylyltransferase family protein [Planctomycetaceae bacterium]
MRAIIIGAGRGSRLMPTTADTPKCFAEVSGQRLLDWAIDAFHQNGINDIVFIGGYRIDCVQENYPQFTFRHNSDWPNNNILASLLYAEDLMDEPFVCCYSDVLFTPKIVEHVTRSEADIALGVDSEWLVRYEHRTEHPSDDAEKVTVSNGHVTRIHREIDESTAHGEFIGLAKFSTIGAAAFREHYHRRRQEFAGQSFREAKVFEKAYLIHLLQDMIEAGQRMAHVDTPGGYIEVDTQQDFEYAREFWTSRHLEK